MSSATVHFPSLTIPCLNDPEKIETDIALACEAFPDASAGIDKIRGELKSLVDKVAKGEARIVPAPQFFELRLCVADRAREYIDRQSTARRSAACKKSGRC